MFMPLIMRVSGERGLKRADGFPRVSGRSRRVQPRGRPLMLGAFLATVLGFGSLVASENLSFGDFAPELEAYFVTANRTPVAIGLVPQSVGWVGSLDLELTPAAFGTDLLKKNFPLDVIQYPGGSSGISIRGFRPQYSHETNPTTLMLIDGRPVSISAGAIPMHGIERIEILRGPASALYGPSAMGGVVNILTKRSEGPFASRLSTGYGSYERVEAGVSAGGSVHPRFSFDVSLDWVERSEDYELGNGDAYETGWEGKGVYRYTTYSTLSGRVRGSYKLSPDWEIELRSDFGTQDRTGMPGSLSAQKAGRANPSVRDLDRGGVALELRGTSGDHDALARFYYNRLDSHAVNSMDSYTASYRGRTTDRKTREWGVQLQDHWKWNELTTLMFGIDHTIQDEENAAFDRDGTRRSYHNPDSVRTTSGLFAELVHRLLDEQLVANLGVRGDRIGTRIDASDYEGTSYCYGGGEESFEQLSPRGGLVWRVDPRMRLRASAGTAFVAPDARQVAGYYTTELAGYTKVCRGAADLDPENAVSWDIGADWDGDTWHVGLTWFQIEVRDRIVEMATGRIEDPLEDGKERRLFTYRNADSQEMRGLEWDAHMDVGQWIPLLPGDLECGVQGTWMERAKVESSGIEEPVKNVAEWKVIPHLTWRKGGVVMRISGRYTGTRLDMDYTYDAHYGGDWYEYPAQWQWDWSLSWSFGTGHTVSLQVENFFDAYVFEKLDYPMEGRNAMVRYALRF